MFQGMAKKGPSGRGRFLCFLCLLLSMLEGMSKGAITLTSQKQTRGSKTSPEQSERALRKNVVLFMAVWQHDFAENGDLGLGGKGGMNKTNIL